jgi:hypothetical protein
MARRREQQAGSRSERRAPTLIAGERDRYSRVHAERLIEFVRPLLRRATPRKSPDLFKDWLLFAVFAWNRAATPAAEKADLLALARTQMGEAWAKEIELLMSRRLALFAEDPLMFGGLRLEPRPDGSLLLLIEPKEQSGPA